ncbi:Asp-tRNA(Asn)/Glu-tRNA(Gln) amidotransferase subunit GatC [Emticicia sp. C21]|uniref:Asp-tRNA(Asn)/Glu-tRNA(Gln) amidotransferase subunit GatC n=1 Tax=Emticicia sp. C21 TaxID=2302915 RepID=UPI000E341E60|nr:Asp-tRNA(Asn)/Glu-tRNA(Gln) amidotransferase subunit GatC [Emticicia sp. C21]RFS15478.1 Asp-tRNA(Asn)/Glu-tRNA(Gln) amidotransferase subunit GatC [Emticicia sp. C21]
MKIEQQTVKKIAHLARLELSEQEEVKMVEDLSKILDWMDQLKELDTTAVEPLTHMSEEVNVFREDVANNQLTREQGLKNAPKQDGEYFLVPKVIEQ